MAALRADQWRRSRALQHARGRERALVAEVAGRRTQTRALAEQLARAAQQVSLQSLQAFNRHSKCLPCGWELRVLAEQLARGPAGEHHESADSEQALKVPVLRLEIVPATLPAQRASLLTPLQRHTAFACLLGDSM